MCGGGGHQPFPFSLSLHTSCFVSWEIHFTIPLFVRKTKTAFWPRDSLSLWQKNISLSCLSRQVEGRWRDPWLYFRFWKQNHSLIPPVTRKGITENKFETQLRERVKSRRSLIKSIHIDDDRRRIPVSLSVLQSSITIVTCCQGTNSLIFPIHCLSS